MGPTIARGGHQVPRAGRHQRWIGCAPYYANAYNAELWVREKDEEAARELLGTRDN